MCGITAFFVRESVPSYEVLDILFKGTENRGQDGFGFVTIKNVYGKRIIQPTFKDSRKYSDCRDLVESIFKANPLNIGDVVIAISRAAPETEGQTDINHIDSTMQPIMNYNHGLVVVHNGAVSGKIYNELQEWSSVTGNYNYGTQIDSEAILCSYVKHQRNMKDCMESISGGFAFIMYDQNKDCLYVVNDHMQLSHSYIQGLGFFLHSELEPLRDIIFDVTKCAKDGVNIWEMWYAHYLDGHAIRCVDLQSGFMTKVSYTPRYITPTFDTIDGIIK